MDSDSKDPLLIFTTKVSRCANGYHLKIRKSDVELLNLKGQMVKIKLYNLESELNNQNKNFNRKNED
jgi:hypothetical protein